MAEITKLVIVQNPVRLLLIGGGNKPITMGALYHLLQNRIYRGEIVHKDKSYPGEHQAIVDEALWDDVQTILASNRVDRTNGATATAPSLLAGILFDAVGEVFTLEQEPIRLHGMLRAARSAASWGFVLWAVSMPASEAWRTRSSFE